MPPARNKSPKALRIIAYVLFAILPVWLFGAGYCLYESHEKLQNWQEAEGQVVALVKKTSHGRHGRRSTSYAPRFVFTSGDGRSYTVTSKSSSNPPEFKVGERLTVLYPEENPADAVQKSFMGLWFLPLMLGVLGLGDALVGCLFLWITRQQTKNLTPVD